MLLNRFTNSNLPTAIDSRRGCVLRRSRTCVFYLPIVSTDVPRIVESRLHASVGGECDTSAIQLKRSGKVQI